MCRNRFAASRVRPSPMGVALRLCRGEFRSAVACPYVMTWLAYGLFMTRDQFIP